MSVGGRTAPGGKRTKGENKLFTAEEMIKEIDSAEEDKIVVGNPRTGKFEVLSRAKVTKNAQEKLERAQLGVMADAPFWATILLNLEWVPTLGVQTLSTDGTHLFWNPLFIERYARVQHQVMMLCHEAWHVGDNIFSRIKGREKDLFFKCHDHTINLSLEKAGFMVPKWALKDKRFLDKEGVGMAPEKIYDLLYETWMKQQEEQGCQACKQGMPKDGQGGEGGEGQQGQEQKPGEGQAQGDPGSQPMKHTCGRNAKGEYNGVPNEEDGGCTVFVPDPEKESDQARELRLKSIVKQAENVARSRGTIPGDVQQILDRWKTPNFDFESYVEPWLKDIVDSEWDSWTRPDQRLLAVMGRVFPSPMPEMTGNVVIIYDTSGSVADQELQYFNGFLSELLRRLPSLKRVLRIQCDAEVRHVDEYKPEDLPLKAVQVSNIYGRGGTDFRPPFKWLEQKWDAHIAKTDGGGDKPSCVIYLTDLEGPFPEKPCEYPTLWVSVNQSHAQAPWGTTVQLDMGHQK